ncbi:NADAR family protein [Streptomyces sp. JL4002]|uniref:NADAR family protein n=1 Tax=Streptomyces sp. JL4002 TaxID=3404781 RepID=UPI003B28A520
MYPDPDLDPDPELSRAAAELADWKFGEPESWITPELLVAEVRDTIDELNGRPDSTDRCLAAVDVFLADRTEENREAARAAFLAVPEPPRRFALGDMDRKDWPLRVLVAGPGGRTYLEFDGTVTQEKYDGALAYFEERARWNTQRANHVPADGPVTPHAPAIQLNHSYPGKRVADPGKLGLRHDYPAPITVADTAYPSVAHAYWALSVAERESRHTIAAAENAPAARTLAAWLPRREDWEHVRTAVMTHLLRAKYDQHPELAEVLLATDDATVIYDDVNSAFWVTTAARAATGRDACSSSCAPNCACGGRDLRRVNGPGGNRPPAIRSHGPGTRADGACASERPNTAPRVTIKDPVDHHPCTVSELFPRRR